MAISGGDAVLHVRQLEEPVPACPDENFCVVVSEVPENSQRGLSVDMLEENVERMGQTPMVIAMDVDERGLEDTFVGMSSDNPAGIVKITNMIVDAPTTPGVWRRIGKEINSSCWELYPFNVAEAIFSAFCDGGSYVEWLDSTAKAKKRKRDADDDTNDSGNTVATHRVYFETMKEVELLTGNEIDVSIVQATISSLNYTSTDDPIETGVWRRDNFGKWHCYGEQAVKDIRKAWRRRDRYVTLKKVLTLKYPHGVKYIINLTKMEQTNPITGRVRPIKIISNAGMPPEVSSPYAGCNLTVFSLFMNLLRGSLQRLLSLEFIHSMVGKTVLPPHEILGIERSKHLEDANTQLLYSKFRQAYETIIKRVPGCCGQLMRIRTYLPASGKDESFSGDDATASEKSPILRHVFYLAAPSEVENILETGLHGGGRHAKENFAFATDYYELNHKSWENSTYSLLLFLVVVPRALKRSAGLLNAIPVASVEHQLPIAKLTLRIPETELRTHESGQSGATDSNCAPQNGICLDGVGEVVGSTTVRRESVEMTTASDAAIQRLIMPSKSEEELFLLFKLYAPEREKLRFVGARGVQMGGRPTEILEWLREIAGLAPDAEIRLYKEDSAKIIDLNSTYRESQLEDGGVIAYNRVLTRVERNSHRCPDLQTSREHVRNRQVLHFRKLSNPAVDQFCLELSSQDTYSDVVERVAQHFGLKDSSKIKLTFNDCILQLPKPLPLDRSNFSAFLGNTYKQTTSILYFEILDCPPPELDGKTRLTIDFHGAKAEKLSAHEMELSKRSTVKDAAEQLREVVSEQLRNSGDGQMRIFEVHCNRISKIHPANERIGYLCATEGISVKSNLRAVEIPEEDKDVGPQDRLIHVRHFQPRGDSRKCDFFGEPFLMVVREYETLAQVKERMKGRVQMTNEEFLECKFALLSAGRREYLHADGLVVSRMHEFSLGFYDPLAYFLGLEHLDHTKPSGRVDAHAGTKPPKRNGQSYASSKSTSKSKINPKSTQAKPDAMSHDPIETCPDQNGEPKEVEVQHVKGLSAREAELTPPLMKSRTPTKSPPQDKNEQVSVPDDSLVLTVVGSPDQGSSKCMPPQPIMPLAVCKPPLLVAIPNLVPDREVTHIIVPDPEFHDFDLVRTEKDVVAGQVWAIYDNHDGMPRYYGLISQVSRLPFRVQFQWLEPHRKRTWWVEVTGVSITCGEFEVSPSFEIERNIGVFSHLVLDKAKFIKGVVEVHPRKGEVWAIFSNWDVLHMLGPKPILTPKGEFNQYYEYDIMQMLDDYSAQDGVPAVRLLKSKGFMTVFHPQDGPQGTKTFRPHDLRKFSHSIPAERMDKNLTGHLTHLHPDAVELDPASLPLDLTVDDGLPGISDLVSAHIG